MTPWTAAHQASLSFTISQSLLKLKMPSNHLILCRPLLLLPSIFPSIRVFSNESALRIRWPKYWSFGFSISPSNEYSGLIFFRIDWFDLLAVQENLKSLLQHHNSKLSILRHSAFKLVNLIAIVIKISLVLLGFLCDFLCGYCAFIHSFTWQTDVTFTPHRLRPWLRPSFTYRISVMA